MKALPTMTNPEPAPTHQVLALLLFLAASALVAGLGGWATASAVESWYPTLAKPAWTPPSFLFGPVWTALYALMALAAWLVWRHGGWRANRAALGLYALQLVLNGLWSFLFFGLRSPGWALVDVALLWLVILVTTLVFWRSSRWAGALFVPYLAWVSFASALNWAIWKLN